MLSEALAVTLTVPETLAPATGAVTAAALTPIFAEAVRRWELSGLTPAQAAALHAVTYQISDLGGGYLEMSGTAPHPDVGHDHLALWLQVPDLAEADRSFRAAGVDVLETPARKPWGLVEMWLADPDGVRICVVEVPDDHPLRRRLD